MEDSVTLASLPDLVLLRIAVYLSPVDSIRLSLTCRRLHDILPRFIRFHGPNFKIYGPDPGPCRPEHYFNGPELNGKVKSLRLSVQWKDQGWGNKKGRLMVKLMRRESGQNRVIAENSNIFGIAEHEWKTAKCKLADDLVVKLAEPGDYYSFERNAGGGGGHSLLVKQFTVLLELPNCQGH